MGGIRVEPDDNDIVVWKLDETGAPFVNSSTSPNAVSQAVSNLTTASGTFLTRQPTPFSDGITNTCLAFYGNQSGSPRNFISGANNLEPQYPISISGWTYIRAYNVSGYRWNIICKQHTAGVWSGGIFQSFVIQNRHFVGDTFGFDYGFTITSGAVFQINGSNGFPVNQWLHCGYTYDGTVAKAYVNGNLLASSNTSAAINYGGHGPWFFGAIPSGSGAPEECALSVFDWRIANVARPQSYFQNIYKLGMTTTGEGQPYARYYKLRAFDTICNQAVYWVSKFPDAREAPAAPCSTLGPVEILEDFVVVG